MQMTAKEYLNQIKKIDQEINAKLEDAAGIRSLAEKVTTTLSPIVAKTNMPSRKVEDAAVKLTDLSRSVVDDIERLVRLRMRAQQIIDKIEVQEYRILLTQRYINYKVWEQIAVDMGYSYLHVVHRLHPKALTIFQEMKDVIECNY